MNQPAPSVPKRPVAWTIASSDPGGGAGIQADLITFNRLGVHGCSILTGITVQNTQSFEHLEPVSPDLVARQIDALRDDLPPAIIKTGMFGSAEAINLVAAKLHAIPARVICDPVLRATLGGHLVDVQTRFNFLERLLPRVHLLTPNTEEAAHLVGYPVDAAGDTERAARDLINRGAKSVLIKGGHRAGESALDFWTDGRRSAWLSSPRIKTTSQHGTGCTLSSAIAAWLALGWSDLDAIVLGKAYVNQGLARADGLGHGRGPLCLEGPPDQPEYLPSLLDNPASMPTQAAFDPLDLPLPDVYPIVDRATWVERLATSGARMIQLRIKDLAGADLETEIQRAVEIGRTTGARVFINDHWLLALKYGAYGVHLGQDDLEGTDFDALRRAGLRLGLSTHGPAELARAKPYRSSYLAIGTLFPSPSKTFVHPSLGLERFAMLQKLCPRPVVAIGGITLEKTPSVLAAGADLVSVISDITAHRKPEGRMREWRDFMNVRG